MASPTSPQIIIPAFKRLVYGVEGTAAGTAATTGLVQESCNSIVTALQRTPYTATEYVGAAADNFGQVATAQYSQITITVPFRVNGFAAQALACLMGNATDTSSGTAPNFTHTFVPSAVNTRCNTMTIWHDTGDRTAAGVAQNVYQMTWATVQSVKLTYNPTGALSAEVTLMAQQPVEGALPVVTNFIGSSPNFSKNRIMGYQGTFKIYNSAAALYVLPGSGALAFSNMVMSGDMTITRPLDPVLVPWNITPQDFVPGPLAIEGSFDMRYDGAGSATVWQDYKNLKELGTSALPNSVLYAIDANNSVEIDFWPIQWGNFSMSDQNQQIRAQVSFTGYNDLGTVNTLTPALTVVKTAIIKNQQTTVMVT